MGIGNPFTSGQTVVPNLTVSGIGLVGATATSGTNRANSSNWPTVASIDLTKYFEFILTPSPGYEIDFTNFIYTSTLSSGTPTIVMRSSVDSFGADIATLSTTGATVNLSTFQNITSAITFRVYVYNMSTTGTTWSINDFQFNGDVVIGTPVPEMNVTQGGSIASGGTNAFGNQENGTSGSAVTFTIQNTGNAVLNLSGTPNKVAITGNTADFVINETATTATVAATSGTTTFTVTLLHKLWGQELLS
ncbi:MAG: hypothetical protein IPO23_02305 [Flavobacterium sp.]|nr:hypothetical protein [Flavobacterium sp.]